MIHDTIRSLARTACACTLLAACSQYPVNPPLTTYDPNAGYRTQLITQSNNSPSLLVILAFSGGGTRAAALSYGVLEQLADTWIDWDGSEERLLDQVDIISAVSGGAFTAAYYGLYGDRIFTDFEERFLTKNLNGIYSRKLLNPYNWFRLASSRFGRSELAAEYFDKKLFDGATYKNMLDGDGPAIIINSTDISTGRPFAFIQDQFDWICSDLTGVPVARAVTASAALPPVLSAVTMNNYAGSCDFETPEWLASALQSDDLSSETFRHARNINSYLDPGERPYVHLLDGAISDNMGLRTSLDEVLLFGGAPRLFSGSDSLHPRKLLIIVVNSQSSFDRRWDKIASGPNSVATVDAAVTIPMYKYSSETIDRFKASLPGWVDQIATDHCAHTLPSETNEAKGTDASCGEIDSYLVTITLDDVREESERNYLKSLPGSLKLPAEDVDRLRAAAKQLLAESPQYKAFLGDVSAGD